MENSTNFNIQYLFYKIYSFFVGDGFISGLFSPQSIIIFKIFSIILSWSLLVTIGILANKLWKLRRDQYEAYQKRQKERMENSGIVNQRWTHVLDLINSSHPSDWSKAIIEADKMLEEVIGGLAKEGTTLGEKMRSIETPDFPALQDAWDAHKTRNRIAHEPGFQLTEREAQRVIGLYGKVFRSAKYI